MIGWHHQLNGYEFQQTLGDSEEQGTLCDVVPGVRYDLVTEQQHQ